MEDYQFLYSNFGQPEKLKDNQDHLFQIPEVIIVEDEDNLRNSLKKIIEKKMGLNVRTFADPLSCLDYNFETDRSYCLLTDISFSQAIDGLKLIDILKERSIRFTAIAMTGFASVETAILATKKGVFHYLTKPFEISHLLDLLKRAFYEELSISEDFFNKSENVKFSNVDNPRSDSLKLIEMPKKEDFFCGIVGRSKKMKKVFERIEKVSQSDSTVFISGASGTGKELVAKALHNLSLRASRPLVSVNCGAIPGELLESELFGHKKGAFTGAISDRKGKFELANTGSIFLDEIGDMPLILQVKLLRVLQGREVEPVGGSQSIPIDVRIITATHRNLEESVSRGEFREDLFYRLNVIPITIPSLAERKDDISILIGHFLNRYVSADGSNNISFEKDALDCLYDYDWPGNVRELENLIERLVILKGGNTISLADLPRKFLGTQSGFELFDFELPQEGVNLKKFVVELEKSFIDQALKRTNGNKNQASKLLGLNRTTLIEKIKKNERSPLLDL
ncbi:MAG: sigma-54-dependent Fis family transcriptional regulator [Halobacteriovoraceae bacterium]|nr:sigma-54-dependent Fis family transcriptional regulator [Halobacteriovoraceae bacterium]